MRRLVRWIRLSRTLVLSLTAFSLFIGAGLADLAAADDLPGATTTSTVSPTSAPPPLPTAPPASIPPDSVPSTSVPPTTPPPPTAPSTTVPVTTPDVTTETPTAEVPTRVGPTAVVGDSLTYASRSNLSSRWRIDARTGRALADGESFEFLAAVATDSPCIVVALGSNDVTRERTEGQMTADVRRVNRLLRDHPCVLWTKVKVKGVTPYYSAEWRRYARQWNRVIRTVGHGEVLNWNGAAAKHPEYFLGDGLHMNARGRAAYATFLRRGVKAARLGAQQ